jgi:hypothetical protein
MCVVKEKLTSGTRVDGRVLMFSGLVFGKMTRQIQMLAVGARLYVMLLS